MILIEDAGNVLSCNIARINQLVSFAGIYKDILGPGLLEVARKHWRLMGFDGEDKILPPPESFRSTVIEGGGGGGQPGQNTEAALTAQAQNNGAASGTPAIPGVNQPPA